MKKSKSMRTCLLLIAILGVSLVIGCKIPVPGADTTPPTVTAVDPENLSTDVPINRKILATFSEAMNPLGITIGTFYVEQGTTLVPGAVSYSGATAVFAPTGNLAASTVYTVTITTGVSDVAGNALESKNVWTFTTGASADVVAPTVASTIPADLATGVAINGAVSAELSEAMDPVTITAANFTLAQGTTVIPGTVTYAAGNAVFTPTDVLTPSTVYTATVKTGVTDVAGNALGADLVWTFTTGAAADSTAPTVASMVPFSGDTNVAINATINATFSEAMNPATINSTTFSLSRGATVVAGTLTYAGRTATFDPAADLLSATEYTATFTTGAKDVAGNALGAMLVWSFTTGTVADTIRPTVVSTVPIQAATGVAINGTVTATFSEAMDPATIVAANFTVAAGTAVLGTVTYDLPNRTATFAPDVALGVGTTYTATVKTGVKDLAGNALLANKVWTFTTASAGVGPAPVILGTAGNYVILAKTAISTVPASVITGDIGLSPAAESFMTGFSQTKATGYSTAPQVTGYMYAADMTPPTPANMTTAISDMEAAYTDAAGRAIPDHTNAFTGNLGGQTLAPGLYKWSTSVTVPSDVTITGNANDVWIFQISGDLTVSNAVDVILGGTAQPKNIFWQVAGLVELGTTSHFEGVILCQTSITLKTGATMNGRALGQSLVALDQATITKPAQ
jgi:hypothetical protein